jgi:biopolymer transport protein ExbB/TolQ
MVSMTASPGAGLVFALTTHDINEAIFRVANALKVPVLLLALVALAIIIFELGSFVVEVLGRHRRRFEVLSRDAERARAALLTGDRPRAEAAIRGIPWSPAVARTASFIVEHARTPDSDHELNKALADFDFDAQKRLGRTRILVRAGPALGLMGTLILVSPALTGLAKGNTGALSENLRLAFSVTVVGLLIGAIAFGLSLTRDRMYGQDLSDLEYLAAVVNDPRARADGEPAQDGQRAGHREPTTEHEPA